MESKYINRYNTFCKSMKNLEFCDGFSETGYAAEKFHDIVNTYYDLFERFRDACEKYYK